MTNEGPQLVVAVGVEQSFHVESQAMDKLGMLVHAQD